MTVIDDALLDVSAPAVKAARIERALFWTCVLAAGAIIWLASKPPMIDLPQHAAQIALWRDLLKGGSPWSTIVFINLLTPYLIGYGSALPLSFVVSPETAIAIVLTCAFYAFVAGCVALRKELGSDDRLDWLFLPSFFGFNWAWGFYTFLTAAPVALFFILLVLRYRRAPTPARGAGLVAAGVALLFSHGLLFLFGLLCAGLILLGPWREPLRARAARLAPIAVLTLSLIVFALVTSERGTAAHVDMGMDYGTPIWLRPFSALLFVTSDNWDPDPMLASLSAVALATPFFLGRSLNRGPAVTLFCALAGVFLLTPAYAIQTGYLFARFALFLPPFFAFLFKREATPAGSDGGERLARIVMALLCVALLGIKAYRVRSFDAESASFTRLEQAAAPGKRALGLIFDRSSDALQATHVYTHFVAYYQADRDGFVDYNFADLHPQVVRFRPDREPAVGMMFEADLNGFDWARDQASIYDYFFVRGAPDALGWLKARSPCALTLVASDGPWSLVRRDSCGAG